jgi:hypothetical protein
MACADVDGQLLKNPDFTRTTKREVDPQVQTVFYSYRRLSTGSSCEARPAGIVPKMIPTSDDTAIAMIADSPETGRR